ncbi:hypothetical protein CSB20_05645 [bacterium DOLZORAL124_64_63]|nr:MAG: hypothetical protein CSB20_05645 [bacterium DOLZORAL124_64_63]
MKRKTILLAFFIALPLLIETAVPYDTLASETPRQLFFLHHSTGRNLLAQGNARQHLSDLNAAQGTDLVLWDHDYNETGLSDPEGNLVGYSYSIPDDNTDPDGLHLLWTTDNVARDSILSRYDVIAFKSCFPVSNIASEADLEQYKTWYLEMRDVFDTLPDKIFVIMSPPPLHRLSTNPERADRARRFASWMTGPEYLDGHPNLVGFDFFDLLASPDDGSNTRNTLRYEYEISHDSRDSHPNTLANQVIAPIFVEALARAARPATTGVWQQPVWASAPANHPNPFNPTTVISFELEQERMVELNVADVRGHVVRHLFRGTMAAGPQQCSWNGCDDSGRALGSGTYFYQLQSGGQMAAGKMILVR